MRQGDGEVEIQAQLIDGRRDQVLWAEAYRRPLSTDDILQVENAIVQRIAGALDVQVSSREMAQLARLPTQHLEALNAYRLGRHFWNQRTAQGLMGSIEYYRRAIALDSSFALAYVGLAESQGFLGQLAPFPPRQFMPEVKQLVLKALALDEAVAEAHSGLGQVLLLYDWDWPAANREFERALELEPNSSMARLWYGQSLSYVGRHAEAVAESRRAVELDPAVPFVVDNLAFRLYYARQYDEALAEARRSLELDPDHWVAYTLVGAVAAVRGQYPDAIAAMQQAYDLSGRSVVPLARLGQAYGMAGRLAAADSVLAELRARAAAGYVPSTYVAMVYAGLGDRKQAFACGSRTPTTSATSTSSGTSAGSRPSMRSRPILATATCAGASASRSGRGSDRDPPSGNEAPHARTATRERPRDALCRPPVERPKRANHRGRGLVTPALQGAFRIRRRSLRNSSSSSTMVTSCLNVSIASPSFH